MAEPTLLSRLDEFVLGPKPTGQIPRRVLNDIAVHERQSELLTSWLQIMLVGLFALYYALLPASTDPTIGHPMFWAIGVFAVIKSARLALAYAGRLKNGLILTMTAVDILLLMALIWSFHIQYAQPPSFSLKVTLFMYVFIFIAFRTLRYDPRFAIMSGAAAVLGWLLIVGYALYMSPPTLIAHEMTTRNLVESVTSTKILLGAEFDKIIAIILVTVILSIAIARARRLLLRASVASAEAADLSRFVPRDLAARIRRADSAIRPGEGRVLRATVMFTDIEGFSTLSEHLDPQDLVATLNDYFNAMSDIAARHYGDISQFQGDAMLITFNTLCDDPCHARHAVEAAIEIQGLCSMRIFGNGVRLRTRCGINTGALISGTVGSQTRLQHTVHGDTVNIAARLEQLNKQYGTTVLASEQTVAAAGAGFGFHRLGEVIVRGRSQPTGVYTLRAISHYQEAAE